MQAFRPAIGGDFTRQAATPRRIACLFGPVLALLFPLQAQAQDPDDHLLRGMVIDQNGRPAANAEVWLVTHGLRQSSTEEMDATRTDAAGHFAVKVPGRWFQVATGPRKELCLLARGGDQSLAALAFDQKSPIPADGVRIDIPPKSETRILVLSPEGEPVAGAKVAVETIGGPQLLAEPTEAQVRANPGCAQTPLGLVLKQAPIPLPAKMQQDLSALTDDDGTVTFRGIGPERIYAVRIESKKYGIQRIEYQPNHAAKKETVTWPARIRLSATGSLRGRLLSENPDWIKRRHFRISTRPWQTEATDVAVTNGVAEVASDDAGRFEVTSLVPGFVSLSGDVDPASRSCISGPEELQLEAGKTREIELSVVPRVRVRGKVEESDSGKPIGDLWLWILNGFDDQIVVCTNARGVFETELAPSGAFMTPLLPRSWVPSDAAKGLRIFFDVPEGNAEVEAPTLKLRRTTTVRGTVIDDDGKRLAGATVSAAWFGFNRKQSASAPTEIQATTNEHGEFSIEGIDLQSELFLQAATATAGTATVMVIDNAPTEPVSLKVSPRSMAGINGRVTDLAGAPIAGVPCELWSRTRIPAPRQAARGQKAAESFGAPRKVEFGEAALRTDAQGGFSTPPVAPGVEYRVKVKFDESHESVGEWLSPAAGEAREVALAVRREGELRGLVRDRQGKPIAAASVTLADDANRVRGTTDAAGTFHLADATAGKGFLFVHKEGFRTFARRLGGEREDGIPVVLETPDEPAAATFKITPRQRDPKANRALALKLVRQLLEAAQEESDRMQALQVLARIDPAAALKELAAQPPKEVLYADMIHGAAAQALARTDLDAALELVATMSPHLFKVLALGEISDGLPESERPRKLEILADALVHVREINQPEFRLCAAALVAERLLDLGERERGEKILRGELDTARQMATAEFAGYARGCFAEEFGQIDLPEALSLLKDLKDDRLEFNRHHGNLAHELAGLRPEDAERVLGLLQPPVEGHSDMRGHYAVRVCYRMAPVDLARAERIAMSISDLCDRGYALGVMATALAEKDPVRARMLLRRAYDVLDEAEQGWDPSVLQHPPTAFAGSLLSLADRLDSDREGLPLLRECVFRTLALVPPQTSDRNGTWYATESATAAALWLAEYDAPLAREVLSRVDREQAVHKRAYVPVLALLSPERLEAFLEGISDDDSRNSARRAAAEVLSSDGDDLRRRMHNLAAVWRIDAEDLE